MAKWGIMEILAVCNHCGYVLHKISNNGCVFDYGPYWTKNEEVRKQIVEQARLKFREGCPIRRVRSCEVCQGDCFVSVLALGLPKDEVTKELVTT